MANRRDWFTSLTPFSTNLTKILSGYRGLHVIGIGDVELLIKTSRFKSGSAAQGRLVLHDVCYAPDLPLQQSSADPSPEVQSWVLARARLKTKKSGASLAIFDNVGGLMRLRFKGQSPNQSILRNHSAYVIRACLTNSELVRWQAHKERVARVGSSDDVCSPEEKQWPRDK